MRATAGLPHGTLLVIAVAAACRPAALREAPLRLGGCAIVTQDLSCLVAASSTLTLVWAHPDPPTVRLLGQSHPVHRVPLDGKWRFKVRLDPAPGTLRVEAPEFRPLRVDVRRAPSLPGVEAVETLIVDGELEEAATRLSMLRPHTQGDRAQLARLGARLAWRGVATATPALELRHMASEAAEQAGWTSFAAEEAVNAGHVLLQEGRPEEALRTLTRARRLAAGRLAQVDLDADMLELQVRIEQGDLRHALRLARKAGRGATALDDPLAARHAGILLSSVLRALGRVDEALNVLAEVRNLPESSPCELALILTFRSWVALTGAEAEGHPASESVRTDLLRALEIDRGPCPSPPGECADLLNLAHFELLRGRTEAARGWLSEADEAGAGKTPGLLSWRLDLEGRVALAQGRPELARASFAQLAELGRRLDDSAIAWRAEIGRAETHAELGEDEAARLAFAAADVSLEGQVRQVGLGDGRATFFARHARALRSHLGVLVDRPEAFVDVVRRARGRWLRFLDLATRFDSSAPSAQRMARTALEEVRKLRESLDRLESNEWRLPEGAREAHAARLRALTAESFAALEEVLGQDRQGASPPPPLPAGALALGFARAGPDLYGYAQTATIAVVRRLLDVPLDAPPEALAAALLEPFGDLISSARVLRVLPSGPYDTLDVHALPFRGAPLVVHLPVHHALDLPVAPSTPPRTALVVANPSLDLPGAAAEGRYVTRALERQGRPAVLLTGLDAAESSVRRHLLHAGHLHFAGHGEADPALAWRSRIVLAGDSRLDVGDVLSLELRAATVFLAGCETGQTRPRLVADLGLAQAFLLAGARAVAASPRPLADDLVRAFAKEVYRKPGRFETRFWRAQRARARADGETDWAALRLYVR